MTVVDGVERVAKKLRADRAEQERLELVKKRKLEAEKERHAVVAKSFIIRFLTYSVLGLAASLSCFFSNLDSDVIVILFLFSFGALSGLLWNTLRNTGLGTIGNSIAGGLCGPFLAIVLIEIFVLFADCKDGVGKLFSAIILLFCGALSSFLVGKSKGN